MIIARICFWRAVHLIVPAIRALSSLTPPAFPAAGLVVSPSVPVWSQGSQAVSAPLGQAPSESPRSDWDPSSDQPSFPGFLEGSGEGIELFDDFPDHSAFFDPAFQAEGDGLLLEFFPVARGED